MKHLQIATSKLLTDLDLERKQENHTIQPGKLLKHQLQELQILDGKSNFV